MNTRKPKPTSVANVFEIVLWNKETQKWMPPLLDANRYRAFGYERRTNGELKRVGRYFRTFAEAKVYALNHAKKKQEALPPVLQARTSENEMRFGELVKQWEESFLPNKDITTQGRYRSLVKHLHFFWNMPVEQITARAIDQWITLIKSPAYLAGGHSTRCSFDHEYSVLRGILKFYRSRENRNYHSPFLPDHGPALKVREQIKRDKDLNVDEVGRFFCALKEVCKENDSEIVYYVARMQYAIYGRVQEAAALHYEDFDFERKRLLINKKMQWARTKDHEDRLTGGAKANGGKDLPLPSLAASIFREWTLKSGIRSGPLFTVDGRFLTYRQIEYRYTQALKRAGLPFSATHILRHAALTEFYQSTKDLKLTAKAAGHGDLKSTEKYVKVRDEQMVEAQRLMDEKLARLM